VVFLQQLGLAATSDEPEDIGESWQGPECVLKVFRDGNFVRFVGSFERVDAFQGLIGAIGGPTNSKSKFNIVYSGTIRGRAVFGTLSREREGASLLESGGANKKALMFFSENGNELSIMERADESSPTFERIRRIQLLPAHNPA
jgi:hypothetical protein